jgi:hypothetical protein
MRMRPSTIQGSVVEVVRVEVGGDSALVQGAPFFDLFTQDLEQGIALDAADDLLLVVERQIARDGARQPARRLFRIY